MAMCMSNDSLVRTLMGWGLHLHLRLQHVIRCQLEDTSGRLMYDGSSIFKLQQKLLVHLGSCKDERCFQVENLLWTRTRREPHLF